MKADDPELHGVGMDDILRPSLMGKVGEIVGANKSSGAGKLVTVEFFAYKVGRNGRGSARGIRGAPGQLDVDRCYSELTSAGFQL